MPKNERVRIVNPVPFGASSIGREHAERYLRSGRAEWASPGAIRFAESDYRYQMAAQTARETGRNYDRQSQVRTLSEIRNIPVLFPGKLR